MYQLWNFRPVPRLFLEVPYNLSYDQTEEYVRDRISFRAFLGLLAATRILNLSTDWGNGAARVARNWGTHFFAEIP